MLFDDLSAFIEIREAELAELRALHAPYPSEAISAEQLPEDRRWLLGVAHEIARIEEAIEYARAQIGSARSA